MGLTPVKGDKVFGVVFEVGDVLSLCDPLDLITDDTDV